MEVHGSIEGQGGANVGECFVGFVILEANTEELAERAKLVVGRWRKGFVLVEEPERPLMGAKEPRVSGQEPVNALEPRREEGSVERCVMGDELSDTVTAAVDGDQVHRGMPLEELGKPTPGISFGNGFASPNTRREMRLAEASWVDLMPLETELHFKRFEFPQPGIDGNRGKLHDWPPRFAAAGFEVFCGAGDYVASNEDRPVWASIWAFQDHITMRSEVVGVLSVRCVDDEWLPSRPRFDV